MQNSWGQGWGEGGFMRILRNSDRDTEDTLGVCGIQHFPKHELIVHPYVLSRNYYCQLLHYVLLVFSLLIVAAPHLLYNMYSSSFLPLYIVCKRTVTYVFETVRFPHTATDLLAGPLPLYFCPCTRTTDQALEAFGVGGSPRLRPEPKARPGDACVHGERRRSSFSPAARASRRSSAS